MYSRLDGISRSFSPSPLLKAESARAGCSGLCPTDHWISPRTNSVFQSWITLTIKRLFLMFKWNFLYFSLRTFLVVLSLGASEKNLASSLHLPMRCLYTLMKYFLSFLLAEEPQLFQPLVTWQMQQLIISMVFLWNHSSMAMSLFLGLEKLQLDVAFQVWPYLCCIERKDHLFWPSGSSFVTMPQNALGSQCNKTINDKAGCFTNFNISLHRYLQDIYHLKKLS